MSHTSQHALLQQVYKFNRYPVISSWFQTRLQHLIASGIHCGNTSIVTEQLIHNLQQYSKQHQIRNVVIGMSGGIDSAVTATLFNHAGYNVTAIIMPILQNPAETARAVEVCETLGISYTLINLTGQYEQLIRNMSEYDTDIMAQHHDSAVRRGNVRARLRMITLYHHASKLKGFVASTDNFSELAAGFWTLHGDVGDVAPIQSLTKSWEVPSVATELQVPLSVIEATPTDGLGISQGDESQFGFSYLEFDIVLLSLLHDQRPDPDWMQGTTAEDLRVINAVKHRIQHSVHKRQNPHNLQHPVYAHRYSQMASLDNTLSGE